MTQTSGEQPQTKKEVKTRKMQFPAQKTFIVLTIFGQRYLDRKVNKWIKQLAIKEGTIPMLNKVDANIVFLTVSYMYTLNEEIPVE